MSYQETFWVVVGTAAPVIALAAVVALPDTSNMFPDFIQSFMSPEFKETMNAKARKGYEQLATSAYKPFQLFAATIQWGAIGNVLIQAGLLAVSLTALGYERDVMPPWVAIVLAVSGILLLALIVSVVPAYRRLSVKAAEAAKDRYKASKKGV